MKQLNLIYGKNVVNEFLQRHPNMIKNIWLKSNDLLNLDLIDMKKIQIKKLTDFLLDDFFHEEVNHQGIVAEIKEYNYFPMNDLLSSLKSDSSSVVLMLDKIQDSHNFGSILRSAALLGIKNVIILDRKQVQINPTTLKTSSGVVYDLKITKVNNLSNALKLLKQEGFWVYSTNLHTNSQNIKNVSFSNKTVLVVGNEGKGVSELVTKNSDFNIFIETNKIIDSFNVSVAASIIMYEISTQLKLLK